MEELTLVSFSEFLAVLRGLLRAGSTHGISHIYLEGPEQEYLSLERRALV